MNNISNFPNFVKVAIVPKKAIFEINITQGGQVIGTGGSENDILKILSDVLHFKYQLVVPSDGGWGYLEDNGTWTGAVGLIQDGQADLAIGKISITEERSLHFDYSYPYDIEVLTFATRLPIDLDRTIAFVWPFSLGLWCAVATLLVVMPFWFWIILQFKYSLMDLIFKLFESFTRQSINDKRIKARNKLLFASWLFGTMFLSSSYCAVLLSFLTVPLKERTLETIEELADAVSRGSYRCMSLKSMTYVLKRSQTQSMRDLGTLIDKNNWNIDPSIDTVKEVLADGRTAVLAPKFFFRHQMQNQVHISKDTLVSLPRSVFFSKTFCCKPLIDKYVLRISASGLYQKIQNLQVYQERISFPWQDAEEYGSVRELRLGDIYGCFYLLSIGYAIASVVFVLEVLHFKYFSELTFKSITPIPGFCKTTNSI